MKPDRRLRPFVLAFACAAALLGLSLFPGQARAWWDGSVWIPGPPVYVAPPPVYAAPPAYYGAPPPQPGVLPGYMVQQPSSAPPVRQGHPVTTCYAGGYTCPLNGIYAPGSGCACPTGTGPNAYGRAG